jgi:hypothetical protein
MRAKLAPLLSEIEAGSARVCNAVSGLMSYLPGFMLMKTHVLVVSPSSFVRAARI